MPDLAALVEIAHEGGALVIVDNTFPSPFLIQPSALGVDLVVHSATKYLGGHGDVIAGAVACDEEFAREVRSIRTVSGGVLGPFEAWLVDEGNPYAGATYAEALRERAYLCSLA